jgi:hypothetical protein
LLFTQAQEVVSKVKVSQQFTFTGAAGCAVLLFTQAQEVVSKVKVSQQLTFAGAAG